MKILREFTVAVLIVAVFCALSSESYAESKRFGGFKPMNMGAPMRLSGGGTRGVAKQPEAVVRSIIQEVDGYGDMAGKFAIKQAKEHAIQAAKETALASANAYIASIIEPGLDFVILDSKDGEKVEVLAHIQGGMQGKRYHARVKTEVKWAIEKSDTKSAQTVDQQWQNDPNAPLTVKIWTEQKVFQEGEKIVLFLAGNRDFYARVVDLMSDGTIIQLLPNTHRRDNFFAGRVAHQVPYPDSGDKFELEVAPPFGTDRLVVFASSSPLGDVATQDIGNGIRLYQGTATQLAKATRGIKIPATTPNPTPAQKHTEFVESAWEIQTKGN